MALKCNSPHIRICAVLLKTDRAVHWHNYCGHFIRTLHNLSREICEQRRCNEQEREEESRPIFIEALGNVLIPEEDLPLLINLNTFSSHLFAKKIV